jgi:uncharacterized membrane protein YidH (DUF202 family)
MVFLSGDIGSVVDVFVIVASIIIGLVIFALWVYVSNTEFYRKKIKNEVFPVKMIFAVGLIISVVAVFLLFIWLMIWIIAS